VVVTAAAAAFLEMTRMVRFVTFVIVVAFALRTRDEDGAAFTAPPPSPFLAAILDTGDPARIKTLGLTEGSLGDRDGDFFARLF